MHHIYRAIEYWVVSSIVDYRIWLMCLIVYNFQICSKKKKLGSTSPSKHIFLISPRSQIPRSKIEKIEKVCGQTSFISDMKLYTISLQNPNKKNSPVNLGASSLNFTGTLLHGFCLVISTSKALFSGGGGCILLSTSSYFGSLWTVKVTYFNWGSNSCMTWIGSS